MSIFSGYSIKRGERPNDPTYYIEVCNVNLDNRPGSTKSSATIGACHSMIRSPSSRIANLFTRDGYVDYRRVKIPDLVQKSDDLKHWLNAESYKKYLVPVIQQVALKHRNAVAEYNLITFHSNQRIYNAVTDDVLLYAGKILAPRINKLWRDFRNQKGALVESGMLLQGYSGDGGCGILVLRAEEAQPTAANCPERLEVVCVYGLNNQPDSLHYTLNIDTSRISMK